MPCPDGNQRGLLVPTSKETIGCRDGTAFGKAREAAKQKHLQIFSGTRNDKAQKATTYKARLAALQAEIRSNRVGRAAYG
jgi:hypothetical protein